MISFIEEQVERLEAELHRLYAGSGPREEVRPDGTVVRYFQCGAPDGMGMDERWAAGEALTQMIETLYEMQRRGTPLHDPNARVEPRNVRRELGDRDVINLGMRANRVPARCRHF